MKFNLGFFLGEALRNLRLNVLMSITAVTTTFICILVFGLGLLVSAHLQSIIGSVREDVSVEAFMPDATDQEVDALANKVATWTEVADVTKVSEEEPSPSSRTSSRTSLTCIRTWIRVYSPPPFRSSSTIPIAPIR